MENNIISDAVRLASKILESLLPDEEWAIVNIARDSRDTFLLVSHPSIPTAFGYNHDKTPNILEKYWVVEGKTIGWWAIQIIGKDSYRATVMPQELSIDDNIIETARKKGYISEDEVVEYFYHVPTEDIGPRIHGQAAILVNRKALEGFLNKFSKIQVKSPQNRDYWYEDRQLHFKLANGGVDQLDFSKANVLRNVFETFWELWKADGKGEYTREQIMEKYNQLFKDNNLNSGLIGDRVGNIRRTIMNKKQTIRNRIKWEFDHKAQVWIFEISPLHSKS